MGYSLERKAAVLKCVVGMVGLCSSCFSYTQLRAPWANFIKAHSERSR